MKIECTWKDRMSFTAGADGHQVAMDTKRPMGADSALSPKQLVLAGICGCTGMDVVGLLKKHKQPLESLRIEAETEQTEGGYPTVFREIRLVYRFQGALDPARVREAVTLSQTLYCGVSAMLSKAAPISYSIELNGEKIGDGRAAFKS